MGERMLMRGLLCLLAKCCLRSHVKAVRSSSTSRLPCKLTEGLVVRGWGVNKGCIKLEELVYNILRKVSKSNA